MLNHNLHVLEVILNKKEITKYTIIIILFSPSDADERNVNASKDL